MVPEIISRVASNALHSKKVLMMMMTTTMVRIQSVYSVSSCSLKARQERLVGLVSHLSSPSSSSTNSPTTNAVAGHCHRYYNHRRNFSIQTSGRCINATRKWYETMVLREKLCPFAPPKVDSPTLRIVATNAATPNEVIEDVKSEIEYLFFCLDEKEDSHNNHETTLIVLGQNDDNHDDDHNNNNNTTMTTLFKDNFRDFVRFSWDLQEQAVYDMGRSEELQLVLFHPKATHQTYATDYDYHGEDNSIYYDNDNPEDYTIRSPYPVIHLLREQDVLKAVQGGYPDLEGLPARNKARLRNKMGIEVCRQRLRECYEE